MVNKTNIVTLSAVLIMSAAPAIAGPDVQEGLWEITSVTEMSGTTIRMPPQTYTQCFSGDDLVPRDPKAPQSCVIKEKSVAGTVVNWVMECSSDGVKTVSTGSIAYADDSFSGSVDIAVNGTDMKLFNRLSGRRLGPCK